MLYLKSFFLYFSICLKIIIRKYRIQLGLKKWVVFILNSHVHCNNKPFTVDPSGLDDYNFQVFFTQREIEILKENDLFFQGTRAAGWIEEIGDLIVQLMKVYN